MAKRRIWAVAVLFIAVSLATLRAASVSPLGRPDLDSIKIASTDPDSEYYYCSLLKKFMANDTAMTDKEFQYFYYGTLFQEDYDPYRRPVHPDRYEALKPVYLKEKQTRSERQMILDYAAAALDDNPVSIQQLVHRIFTFEKNGKYDLAHIWQYKLNHLLLVIASSGSGTDPETARAVVYPEHEYDLLNLAGFVATGQRFEYPCYDYISVRPRNGSDPEGFYFDVSAMLEQYYLKHPSELRQPDDAEADMESEGETEEETADTEAVAAAVAK